MGAASGVVRPLARAGGRESCDVTRLLQKEPLDGFRETHLGRRWIEGVLATGSTLRRLETPGPPPTTDVSARKPSKNQPIEKSRPPGASQVLRHSRLARVGVGRQAVVSSPDVVSARKHCFNYPT